MTLTISPSYGDTNVEGSEFDDDDAEQEEGDNEKDVDAVEMSWKKYGTTNAVVAPATKAT